MAFLSFRKILAEKLRPEINPVFFLFLSILLPTLSFGQENSSKEKKILVGKWIYVIDPYLVSPPIEIHLFANDSVQSLTPEFKTGKWNYNPQEKIVYLYFATDTLPMTVLLLQKDSLKVQVPQRGAWSFVPVREIKDSIFSKISAEEFVLLEGEWRSYKRSKVNTENGKGYAKEKYRGRNIIFISQKYGVIKNAKRQEFAKFYCGRYSASFFADTSNRRLLEYKPRELNYYKQTLVYFMTNHSPPSYIRTLKPNKLVIESFYDTRSMGYYQRFYFKKERKRKSGK